MHQNAATSICDIIGLQKNINLSNIFVNVEELEKTFCNINTERRHKEYRSRQVNKCHTARRRHERPATAKGYSSDRLIH